MASPGGAADPPDKMKIFVLADTHDKLPANIEALAAGADEIWHLGDVCAPAVLETIEAFGPPVTAVRREVRIPPATARPTPNALRSA